MVLTSLITAIPGALLVFVTVMSFLRYAGGWSIGTQALSGLLLLIGLGLALMPVGIYVLGGPKAEKEAKDESESAAESAEVVAAESGETPASEELISDSSLEVDEMGTDEFAMTGEVLTPEASGEDFDLGEEADLDEALFEEEEDEGPKKGKKK